MNFLKKILWFIEFIFFYLWKVLESNVYVAIIILTPTLDISPAIVEIPVHLHKKFSKLLFFNLITMTPGTLSMDMNNDEQRMYIHTMDLKSEETFVKNLEQLESKIEKIFE